MIPTLERPRELRRALAAVLAQRDVALEVIAIEDASPEPYAAAAVAEFGDERARALRLPTRGGPAAARNAGLEVARGEWVAFLDDDDDWADDKLRAQIDALDAAAAQWAWCAASVVRADGTELYTQPAPPPERIAELLLHNNAVPGSSSSVIVRTALVRELGGFDERFAHLADWDLWIRLAGAARAASEPEFLVTHRVHEAGMHSRDTDGALREFRAFVAKHPEVHSRIFLRWIAGAHWRAGRRGRAMFDYALGRLRYRD